MPLGVDDGRLLVLLPGALSVDDGGATGRWFLSIDGVGLGPLR
jgi:hypothetical protein